MHYQKVGKGPLPLILHWHTMTRRQSLLQRPYLHCKHCHETKNVSFNLMAYIFQPYASYTSSISQHPTGLLSLEAKISSRPLLWLRITSWNMLLLGNTTGGNKDWNAVNFTLFLPGKAMNITYSNTVKSSSIQSIWNRIPLLYPHCHQKAHSKQQEKKEQKTTKNPLQTASASRGKGVLSLLPTTYNETPSL